MPNACHSSAYASTLQPSPRNSFVTNSSEGLAHENIPRMLTSGFSTSETSSRGAVISAPASRSSHAQAKWSA